ncbi:MULTISPECIES: hypothetical protein [Bacillus cereus group]|uniref:Uncharacterized protein n=1 Tax=Bacillus thuringiensis TaxID=1428 RepID=A0A9X6ZQU0_BACTU|nr:MULTISPECIES: hypothetical protein [Bacillus cereus group]PFJ33125.1 hypothetical protein COJ15_28180 [Bacillus thuringiensis]PGP14532.1 hypothetical protein COA01_29660 [Bacillus cereus]
MLIQGVKEVESRTIRSFRIKLDGKFTNGHEFCELIVDEQNKNFTARLYNETYSYSWGATKDDFIQFLIDIFSKDTDYLFGNLEDSSFNNFVDTEKTAENMQKLLLEARYKRNIDEDEARELWEEIESFSSYEDVTLDYFYTFYFNKFEIGIKNDVISNEPWFEEFVEREEDYKCRVFCKKVAPILAQVLKHEYQKS